MSGLTPILTDLLINVLAVEDEVLPDGEGESQRVAELLEKVREDLGEGDELLFAGLALGDGVGEHLNGLADQLEGFLGARARLTLTLSKSFVCKSWTAL